jgi:acyl-coenzyme A synthetase/AMP-(fatty) acid ligase
LNQSLQPLFTALSKVRKVRAPSLDDILAEDPVPHYEYNQTFESAPNEPFLHLHTSGLSGNPKPISGNKKYLASFDTAKLLPQDQGGSLTIEFLEH